MNRQQTAERNRHIIHLWKDNLYTQNRLAKRFHLSRMQIYRILRELATELDHQHRQQNLMERDLREREEAA